MSLRVITPIIAGVALLAAAAAPTPEVRPPHSFDGIADRAERSRALFVEMSRVIQHPRCLNCHPDTRRPLQGDDGHLHSPPVEAEVQTGAFNCRTCHQAHNTPGYGGGIQSIPGAENWALAPESMAWVGKTAGQICRQLKDRSRNGDRDLAALHTHMAEDHLVGWGWHPGIGRRPVPGTQAAFGELVAAWIDTGAECPAP